MQAMVEYLRADMGRKAEEVKWYDLYKIAFSSLVGNHSWSTKDRKVDLEKLTSFVLASEDVINAIIKNEGPISPEGVPLIDKFTVKLQEYIDALKFKEEYDEIRAYREEIWKGTYGTFASLSASKVIKDERVIKVKFEGKDIQFHQESGYPFIKNGRTYLPLKVISDSLGLKVEWIPKNKTVIVYDYHKKIYLPIGLKEFNVTSYNNKHLKTIKSDVAPLLVSGRTYLPLSVLLKEFEYEINWENSTSTITITK